MSKMPQLGFDHPHFLLFKQVSAFLCKIKQWVLKMKYLNNITMFYNYIGLESIYNSSFFTSELSYLLPAGDGQLRKGDGGAHVARGLKPILQ